MHLVLYKTFINFEPVIVGLRVHVFHPPALGCFVEEAHVNIHARNFLGNLLH